MKSSRFHAGVFRACREHRNPILGEKVARVGVRVILLDAQQKVDDLTVVYAESGNLGQLLVVGEPIDDAVIQSAQGILYVTFLGLGLLA